MTTGRCSAPPRRRQRGAALVLALLLLLLLSGVVTTAFSDNQWQWRIASHQVSEERAEQAARSALTWAEDWLLSRPGDTRPLPCAAPCGTGAPVLGAGAAPARPERMNEAWWLNHGWADGYDPDAGASVTPRRRPGTPPGRWYVEEAHFEPGDPTDPTRPATSFYRVVARAARAPRGTPVVLEAVIARPWGQGAWSDALPADARRFCRQAPAPQPCGRMSWQRRQ